MITIGIASYGNPEKLRATIESIEKHTVREYRLRIWNNPHSDEAIQQKCRDVMLGKMFTTSVIIMGGGGNVGYAGAVNGMLAACDTDYFLYCDNDIEILTPGWDVDLCKVLDENPEVAQVFPGAGHFGFFNSKYHECLWNAGYCWALRSSVVGPAISKSVLWASDEVRGTCLEMGIEDEWPMDRGLGHHDEVDLMIRLRLAGQIIACVPSVQVLHHESSTQSPESAKRIHAGVVRWMNKWNRYFCGDVLKYPNPDPDSGEGYDPRSLRYTDWPPCALYLERWALHHFPRLNISAEVGDHYDRHHASCFTVSVPGVGEMDLINVLKPKGYYRGRAI